MDNHEDENPEEEMGKQESPSSDPDGSSEPVVPRGSSWRMWVGLSFGLLFSFALLLAVGEFAIRKLNPDPRVQIIRDQGELEMEVFEGVPVWRTQGGALILNEGCVESYRAKGVEPLKVMLFGSSIFYGSSVLPKENFSLLLQEHLDRDHSEQKTPPVCVMNYGQPAYGHASKFAVAKREVRAYKPDLIFWEIWANETSRYSLLGDTAYRVDRLDVGEDGLPSLFGMPSAANRWLLLNSKLYEYAAIALAQKNVERAWEDVWSDFAHEDLADAVQLAASVDAEIRLVFCPRLDTPFSETAARWPSIYIPVRDYAQETNLPYYWLSDVLIEEDYLEMRVDTCCHYSVAGHIKLEEHFYSWTREVFSDPSPPSGLH